MCFLLIIVFIGLCYKKFELTCTFQIYFRKKLNAGFEVLHELTYHYLIIGFLTQLCVTDHG